MRIIARLVAGLPLASFVALDPAGWYPFGPAKWLAVSAVAATAVAAVAWRGEVSVPRLAGTLWLGLLILIVAAAIIGLDPRLAWLGTAERNLGVAAWVLFAACTLVGASLRRSEVVWFARGTVAAVALTGVYALVELLGDRPIALDGATSRLGATFGSAAYLGAAMCLTLPICLGVALARSEHRWWRVAAVVATIVGGVAVVGSGTRGAWLGLVGAGIAVVLRTRGSWVRPSRRTMVLAGLGLATVVVLSGPRLGDVVERDAGAQSRLDEWAVAVDVIGERPLLGVGPEGYRLVAGESIDAEYERSYGRATSPDRAHSAPLDVAAIAGIPAALVFVALLVVAVVAGWRSMSGGQPIVVGLAGGVVAYALQQILLFPVAEIDPLFWLASGALLTGTAVPAWRLTSTSGRRSTRAVSVVASLAAATLFVVGLTGVAADRLARRGADAHDGATAALADVERAIELRPDVIRNHLLLAELAAAAGTLGGTDAAIDRTARAAEWSPRDPLVGRHHAALRTERAEITGDDLDARRAVAAWRDVIAHDPNCAPCLIGLGAAAALAGDAGAAHAAWTAAAGLTDDPLPGQLLEQLDMAAGS